MSIIRRVVSKLLLPLIEGGVLYASLIFILQKYSEYNGIEYNWDQAYSTLGLYTGIWLTFLWLFSGYDKPWVPRRVLKGIAFGTLALLAIYGLFPESMRFSRAILLLGSASFTLIIGLGRIIFGRWRLGKKASNRLVVASSEEAKSIYSLLESLEPNILSKSNHSIDPKEIDSISDYIRIHKIGEVVFSGRDVTASSIITSLASISGGVICRIAWTDDGSVMGSGGPGPDPVTELDGAIYGPPARRSKRILDISLSFLLILFSPLLVLTGRWKWVGRAVSVGLGFKTWVGINIPGTNKGAFSKPFVVLAVDSDDIRVRERLSLSYAKQYHPFEDLKLVLNALLLQKENS